MFPAGCRGSWFCVRGFATFNSIFSHFLQFLIPLIIIGLVTPAIAEIGKGAGVLLAITALIAYLDTVFAGCFSYLTSVLVFPKLISGVRRRSAKRSENARRDEDTKEIS